MGRYPTLDTAKITYRYCLNKWLEYLNTNSRAHYSDDFDFSITEEELISRPLKNTQSYIIQ